MVNVNFTPDPGDLEILAALRTATGAVSGQVLADRLGISRVALWKRIQRLNGFTYRIQGGHGGYRLVEDDAVVPWEFRNGDPVVYRSETGSTMDEAWTLAERGAASGTLVIADRQSAGRGRQGRPWQGAGGSLCLTLVLRPRLPASHAASLALEAACVLGEWLEATHGRRLECHWPNDLMAAGRKVGGLLVELAGAPEAPRFYLLGLGLDLRAMDLPDHPAHSPMRRDLAAAFRERMAAWAETPRLRPGDWERRCPQLSRPVALQDWQGRTVTGIARGFAPHGGLILADPASGTETIFPPEEVLTIRLADAPPCPETPHDP
ncbi:MAG: biotin--[acetyl-CoA-carboxylase] ligase [Holophaga sp.]|nr:biotin--[acetyl-CoA-carboxylase] ligase [Holophaga sp.]